MSIFPFSNFTNASLIQDDILCENSTKQAKNDEKNQSKPITEEVKAKRLKSRSPNYNPFLDINCIYKSPNELNSEFFEKNNVSDLTVFHNNVRSLNKNFKSVGDIFLNCDNFPDILAITETKLNGELYAPNLEGYHPFEGVESSTDAGGVGIYVSNNFDFCKREDLSLNVAGCEDFWVSIYQNSNKHESPQANSAKNLVIGTIYRHPGKKYKAFSKALSKTLSILNKNKIHHSR